jgi:radical SAM superfamily enzyme YgiQ (UPF0313 family)
MSELFAVILSVPTITPIRPSLAPAIIKSLIESQGFESTVVDINIDFWNNFKDLYGNEAFFEVNTYLTQDGILSERVKNCYHEWINKWVDRVLEFDAKHILISVFTWQAQKFTKDFLSLIKSRTSSKIIIGGQGIGEVREQTSFIGPPLYAHKMKQLGLIDHWIKGDAESTIPLICQGIYSGPGIDTDEYAPWGPLKNQPAPNFDDVKIHHYHSGDPNGVIPIEISRGCVRECNFCDWVTSAGGFRSKTGKQLFQEIKNYIEKYNCRNFYFVDALMNGSIKEFNAFNRLLINYYRERGWPDRSINYSGHFIIRGPHQGWKKEYIELMGRAGANIMVVGVETGSDSVRTAMNKGYTNKDLDYNMNEFVKHGIKLYMLMMVGYPTETRKEFEETLDLLKKYQVHVANGHIGGINFGQTFVIEEGAPIFYHPEQLDLKGIEENKRPKDVFWINPKNPTLTYKERILRRIEAQEFAVKLGYPLWRGDSQLLWLMNKYKEIVNGTYNEHKIKI